MCTNIDKGTFEEGQKIATGNPDYETLVNTGLSCRKACRDQADLVDSQNTMTVMIKSSYRRAVKACDKIKALLDNEDDQLPRPIWLDHIADPDWAANSSLFGDTDLDFGHGQASANRPSSDTDVSDKETDNYMGQISRNEMTQLLHSMSMHKDELKSRRKAASSSLAIEEQRLLEMRQQCVDNDASQRVMHIALKSSASKRRFITLVATCMAELEAEIAENANAASYDPEAYDTGRYVEEATRILTVHSICAIAMAHFRGQADHPMLGFVTPDDTGIPQLQRWLSDQTLVKRYQFAQHKLTEARKIFHLFAMETFVAGVDTVYSHDRETLASDYLRAVKSVGSPLSSTIVLPD